MRVLLKSIYIIYSILEKIFYKLLTMPIKKSMLAKCGKNVFLDRKSLITYKNVFVGSNVVIGTEAMLISPKAKIIIGDNVMIEPKVTIMTKDNNTDVFGKPMIDANENLDNHNKDVVIEGDVWIGANVTILKGVKIGEGSVVTAGSIVMEDVEPYTIVAGAPAQIIRKRFNDEQIKEHKLILSGFRKKVVMVLPCMGVSDVEKTVIDIALYINKEQFDITILSLQPRNDSLYENISQLYGIKVTYIDKRYKTSLTKLLKVTSQILEIRPDIIHTHLNVVSYTLLSCILGKIKSRIHTVYNTGNTTIKYENKIVMKLAYKFFDFTPVGICDYTTKSITEQYKLKENKVFTIYSGIDTNSFVPICKNIYSDDETYILSIGNFTSEKNVRLMLDAFNKVCEYNEYFDTQENIYLKLIGYEYFIEVIEEQVRKYHLEYNIIIQNEISDIGYELNQSDILLIISDYEGLPSVILEAMACGLPIIATKFGGITDVIENEQNGILVESDNKEEIVDAIIKLQKYKRWSQMMGENSRVRALRYDISKTTKQYENLYIDKLNKTESV